MPAHSPPPGNPSPKRIPIVRAGWPVLLGGAVLAIAALAVYSRTFSVPLLLDDQDAIVDNATIRHLSTAFVPPVDSTAGGRPILNLSLATNYAISGASVWSYHVLNLLIHVLAGLALFGIVRRTLVRRGNAEATLIGFGAALLWTLHPLQTEAVTYIVQRAESLMGLFYLFTLYCFIRGAEGGDRQRSWYSLSVAACLLGMATKEVMATAPLIVLLYDRTFVGGSFREALRRRRGVHLALGATWLLLAGLVAGAGWDRNGTSGFDVGIRPWAYWLTQFEAVCRYLWLSVWPHPLVFEYGTFWVKRPLEVAPYAVIVVGLTAAVLVALWRRPVLGFLGAWFFAILAPTSVMPGRIQMIVEHRMYLPLAALIVAGVAGLHAAMQRLRDHGPQDNKAAGQLVRSPLVPGPVVSAVLLLALALGALTALRNEDYRSELGIWSDTVARRPQNERAHANLGAVLAQMPGRLDDAIAEFREALRLNPGFSKAHYNLGNAWSQMPGRLNDAAAEYQAALRASPNFAEAHNNLGNVFSQEPGRSKDAAAEYEAALRLKPDYAEAHNNLGLAWSRMPGRLDDVIAQYEEALRLKPDYAEAHYNLGNALSEKPGRLNDAIAEYEAALRIQPGFAKAHYNLGNAWSRIPGRLNDAIVEYETALRMKPDFAPGWHNLGVTWVHLGYLSSAATAFRKELSLSPGDPAAQKALAAVLQQSGGH
jgi:protein O-mannosyl-transferase